MAVSEAQQKEAILAGFARMRGDPTQTLVGMGHVDATTATVWIDTSQPRTLEWRLEGELDQQGRLETSRGPMTVSVGELRGGPLEPGTRYRLVFDGTEPLTFHTDYATDAPDAAYAIAIGSCHQPFGPDGSLDERAVTTLGAFATAAAEVDARRTLLLGDQMYTDQPIGLSLFAPEVVRALSDGAADQLRDVPPETLAGWLNERYRAFWNVPEWRRMMRAAPTYMMWDDHELWDNFGAGQHDRSEARRPIVEAAQGAFQRFQRLGRPRQHDTPDFSFRYGRLAAVVLDSRTHRGHAPDGFRIFSDEQRTWLPQQLDALADAAVLLVGLSVPFLTFPSTAVDLIGRVLPDGNNIQDRWAFGEGRNERRWLLETLVDHADRHPRQKIIIVGGDIHIGLATEFVRPDGRPPIRQFVSSAISNRESKVIQSGVALASRVFSQPPVQDLFSRTRLIPGVRGHSDNPFTGQNMGFVEVKHCDDETAVRLSLMSGGAAGQPWFPFRSEPF